MNTKAKAEVFFYCLNMNKRRILYTQLIQGLSGLIGLQETGDDEDKTLRSILVLLTQLRDDQRNKDLQNYPVDQQLQNNFNYAKEQGGAF